MMFEQSQEYNKFRTLTSRGSRAKSKPSSRIEVKHVTQSSIDGSPSSGTSNLGQNLGRSMCARREMKNDGSQEASASSAAA